MMNNKALVEIFVPASGSKFDVFVPLESKMSDVLKLVSAALSDLSDGKYKATNDAVLCDAKTGIIFNVNMEVAELGIKNGSRLMLI
jgi:hypothetical protein